MIDFEKLRGFDWDEDNSRKSVEKHAVTQAVAEPVFTNDPLVVVEDARHRRGEMRFNALGRTFEDRRLPITFTLRQYGTMIRNISARDINRKEGTILCAGLSRYQNSNPNWRSARFGKIHDSIDYLDWSKARRVRFPDLKPATIAISIRLPSWLLDQMTIAANKRDVPSQSLIKMWLAEKVG